MNGDADFGGVTREGFVDGVVYDFVDQVVQTHFTGRPDVHGRAQPNSFEALQYLDAAGIREDLQQTKMQHTHLLFTTQVVSTHKSNRKTLQMVGEALYMPHMQKP